LLSGVVLKLCYIWKVRGSIPTNHPKLWHMVITYVIYITYDITNTCYIYPSTLLLSPFSNECGYMVCNGSRDKGLGLGPRPFSHLNETFLNFIYIICHIDIKEKCVACWYGGLCEDLWWLWRSWGRTLLTPYLLHNTNH
jgi:hypothetical protein